MTEKILDQLRKITYYPRKWIDLFIFHSYLKRTNDWQILNRFFQKDILVVGNGPSLNQTPLDSLNEELVSVGMNKINLIYDKVSWRPDILVCVNALVLKQNRDYFNSTEIPLILPVKALYIGIKPRRNTLYVNLTDNPKVSTDIKKSVSSGCTVTFTALQVAAHLNPASISIVGVDHSFIQNNGKDHEIKKLQGDDPNHFSKDYFKGQFWGLPNLEGSEELYRISKNYFEDVNVPIVDYTVNGKLNVFQKGDIADIMSTYVSRNERTK